MIRGFINALGTDLAYAVRNYSRSPLFTATIRRQRREIGIRMALGAPTGRIFRDVMRRGLRLAVIGVGLGIVGAVGVVRAMKGLVFGVDVLDGTTFAAVSAIGLIVATTASLSPALRASRVDPLKILQSE